MASMGVGGVERDPLLGVASTNPLAVGRTVYGNGTLAPTRGPVDISGYRERDLTLQRLSQRARYDATKAIMEQLFGSAAGSIPQRRA